MILFTATLTMLALLASVSTEAQVIVITRGGARTAWHSHPRGQILIVTAGTGRVQAWGGPAKRFELETSSGSRLTRSIGTGFHRRRP